MFLLLYVINLILQQACVCLLPVNQ